MELRDMIARHIAVVYDNNQSAFARAVGESSSIVNRWVTGRITLPTADMRRKLARELGVRHVDILVAAGELWPSEVEERAAQPSEADQIMSQLDAETRAVVLLMLRRFLKTTRAEQVALSPPAPVPVPHDS